MGWATEITLKGANAGYARNLQGTKTRINISTDRDLAEYVKIYAQENRTTTSEVFTQFILGLKRRNQGDSMNLIYASPDFHKAILDVKNRLQNGSAEWHRFDEVFTD